MRKAVVSAGAVLAMLLGALPRAHAADPYTIEVVLPLTGPAAFLGEPERTALQRFEAVYAKEEAIGGRKVHFEFHDDQSSPQTAVQLASQIVSQKPAVVLGSGLVAMCNAMAPLMRRGPVMYCFSPGIHPPAGSFVFSGSSGTKDLAAAQIRYFRLKGLTRLAIITSTDASGQDAARNIKQLLALPENKGITVVGQQTFNPTDISAAAQLERLKGANPQALIAWSTGAAIGTVFKAIRNVGLDIPVATTDGNMTYAAMHRFADILPKELYISSPEWPQSDKLHVAPAVAKAKDRFFAAYQGTNIKPDAASTYAWDPAVLVVDALRALGPNATAEQLRARLAGLKGVAGVNGTYDFPQVPQRGLDESNVVVTRWDKATQTWTIVSKPRGAPL